MLVVVVVDVVVVDVVDVVVSVVTIVDVWPMAPVSAMAEQFTAKPPINSTTNMMILTDDSTFRCVVMIDQLSRLRELQQSGISAMH